MKGLSAASGLLEKTSSWPRCAGSCCKWTHVADQVEVSGRVEGRSDRLRLGIVVGSFQGKVLQQVQYVSGHTLAGVGEAGNLHPCTGPT